MKPWLASEPAPLDPDAALRAAATAYDDAAAARVFNLAMDIHRELKRMQDPRRALRVRNGALARVVGQAFTADFNDAMTVVFAGSTEEKP